MAFVIPLVFSSWLELHHDVYYLVYSPSSQRSLAPTFGLAKSTSGEVITANWKLSIAVGIASAAFVTWSVLGRIPSTLHPSGAYFVFEIGWRGIVYGFVDALLLRARAETSCSRVLSLVQRFAPKEGGSTRRSKCDLLPAAWVTTR